MPMRWDPLLAAATARELNERFSGRRVRALQMDAESRRLTLYMREGTLVFELHPLEGWISLLPEATPPSDARPLSTRIRAVGSIRDESAFVFDLARIRGREEDVELIVELVGNRWNAVVVGRTSRVIRHVLISRDSGPRRLTVGSEYAAPPTSGRAAWDGVLDREGWNRILATGDDDPKLRRRALLAGVAWASSLNVEWLLAPDGLARWSAMIDPSSWKASVHERPKGLQPYPVEIPPITSRSCDTLLDAIREARRADPSALPVASLLVPAALLARAERRLHQAESRARSLARELEAARDPAPVRAIGDLLLARFTEVPRGAGSVKLIGFDGNATVVELDPTLTPSENAERYYAEAARMDRARTGLPKRIRSAEAEIERWKRMIHEVTGGQATPGALESALGPTSMDVGGGQKRGGNAPVAVRVPYHRFVSSGGYEIRVGRGPRDNDDLTFHHSAPDDIWLHARQVSGAHVILRWTGGGSPPRRDLAEAASLAALNSGARHSAKVAVGWTRRKYVRKPRKAPPGTVTPDRIETVFVAPDPKLAERLAAE